MRKNFIGVFVAVILMAGSAAAEIGEGMAMFTLTGSYQYAKLSATGTAIDGGSFNASLDVVGRNTPVSFWIGAGWGQMTAEESAQTGPIDRTLRTYPLLLGMKFWFGNEKIKGYAGVAASLWFSTLDTTVDGSVVNSENAQGGGVGVPIGVAISLSRGTNLIAGYLMTVTIGNQFLENNLLHVVGVGLGFSWGG